MQEIKFEVILTKEDIKANLPEFDQNKLIELADKHCNHILSGINNYIIEEMMRLYKIDFFDAEL